MRTKSLQTWIRISSQIDKAINWKYLTKTERENTISSSEVQEILDLKNDYFDNYFQLFRHELFNNLLLKETTQGKRDVLKYYIFHFVDFNLSLLQDFKYLVNENEKNEEWSVKDYRIDSYVTSLDENKRIELTEIQKYIMCLYTIINGIFNEIQDSCFCFGIIYFDICDELGFKCTAIDCQKAYFGQSVVPYEKGYSTIGTPWDINEEFSITQTSTQTTNDNTSNLQTKSVSNNAFKRQHFSKYLKFEYKMELAEMLKVEYDQAMGKRIALLIATLKEAGELKLQKRQNSAFLEDLQLFLGWNIGARTSISYCKKWLYRSDLEPCIKRLNEMKEEILQQKNS